MDRRERLVWAELWGKLKEGGMQTNNSYRFMMMIMNQVGSLIKALSYSQAYPEKGFLAEEQREKN